ncbi:MAG: hypothetical protein EOO77_23055 [Oxalobacteraceae bacterium]|nr:MAG: hypothetical protein EOO77_23055 [Oxalobacteraceae bacterium]
MPSDLFLKVVDRLEDFIEGLCIETDMTPLDLWVATLGVSSAHLSKNVDAEFIRHVVDGSIDAVLKNEREGMI